MPTYPDISPAGVRRALLTKNEIALLDVRRESQFARGHPLFAASFPLGQLEALATERLPRPDVPIVVYGDGAYDTTDGSDPDAEAAAGRLRQLGYRDVSLLDGGLDGWAASGGELFSDVNAPSKAFGELVAGLTGTPLLPAQEVSALLRGTRGQNGAPGQGGAPRADGPPAAVVVDARRFDEYATMSIPTATSVPGAELVLRVRQLAPDPATTVIVNCAGRTRSIIGAQSLINAGLPNRVVALRNGTIGWTLAGLELDHGQARVAPEVPAAAVRRAASDAWRVADRAGVRRVAAHRADGAGLAALPRSLDQGGTRTVYLFDVRTPQEYLAGHLPGFRSAPGGQLVQETDWYAPVRGALLVLADDGGGRAAMTGSWLAQMGWDVVVATRAPGGQADDAGLTARGSWRPARPPAPTVPVTVPSALAGWLRAGEAVVIDLETSKRFLAGHIPGAAWAPRADLTDPELVGRLGRPTRVVLTSSDGYMAAWAAADLGPAWPPAGQAVMAAGQGESTRPSGPPTAGFFALAGGTQGWERSGRSLDSGGGDLLSPAVDVYRRPYEGTDVDPTAMQAYLDWEYGLVAQLERDGTHGFHVLVP
jgi:rhodanese-related sulfurtransferase